MSIASPFSLSILVCAASTSLAMAGERCTEHHRHAHAHHAHNARAITVHPRAFTDAGLVQRPGALQFYAATPAPRTGNAMEAGFGRTKFGNETLPERFALPGRAAPLFVF